MKLTFFQKIRMRLGYEYLLNTRSQEIHWLKNLHPNCKVALMARKNKQYLTRRQSLNKIQSGISNGCRWCWSEKNTG